MVSSSLTIILVGLLYLIILNPFPVKDFITNFHYMLMTPTHTEGIASKLLGTIKQLIQICNVGMIWVCGASAIIWWRYIIQKKNIKKSGTNLLLISFLIVFVYGVLRFSAYAPVLYAIYTFPFFLVLWLEHRVQYETKLLYLLGYTLAFSFVLGSNTKIESVVMGMVVSSMAAVLFLDHFIQRKDLGYAKVVPILSSMILLVIFACYRGIGVYRDANIELLNYRLKNGPAAGIYTTVEHGRQYERVYEIITELYEQYPDANVMYSAWLPWAYLCTDFQIATPTVWKTKLSEPRMEAYYTMHPDKVPDIVVIFREDIGKYEDSRMNTGGGNQKPNQNDFAGYLWEYLQTEKYVVTEN